MISLQLASGSCSSQLSHEERGNGSKGESVPPDGSNAEAEIQATFDNAILHNTFALMIECEGLEK